VKNRTVVSTHPKSTFWTLISLVLRGDAPENFKIGREWRRLANAYPVGDGSSPTIFYKLKFENWPKIQCTLVYIVGICRGESHKHFPCDVSWYVHVNFGFKLRGFFPLKILEPKNVDFNFAILGLHRKYSQNVTSYRQSENGVTKCNVSLTLRHHLVYFGHKRRKVGPWFRPTHGQLLYR